MRAAFVPALYALANSGEKGVAPRFKNHVSHPHRDQNVAPKLTAFSQSIEETPTATTQPDVIDQGDRGAVLVVVVSERVVAGDQAGLDRAEVVQVNMWEVHWIVPANRPAKPISRKT